LAIDPIKRDGEIGEVRNIEEWLAEVETQMKDSLKMLVRRSLKDYGNGEHRD